MPRSSPATTRQDDGAIAGAFEVVGAAARTRAFTVGAAFAIATVEAEGEATGEAAGEAAGEGACCGERSTMQIVEALRALMPTDHSCAR